MKIAGIPHRLRLKLLPGTHSVRIIDQTVLPHQLVWRTRGTLLTTQSFSRCGWHIWR